MLAFLFALYFLIPPRVSINTNFVFLTLIFCDFEFLGVAPEGQLARSAQITSPDEKGNYDLTKLVKESDEDFIVEKFLTPAPVIYGRLPHERKSVLSVACGFVHMLVVARDPGSYDPFVYGAGDNSFGALGLGVEVDKAHELTLVSRADASNSFAFYFISCPAALVTSCLIFFCRFLP